MSHKTLLSKYIVIDYINIYAVLNFQLHTAFWAILIHEIIYKFTDIMEWTDECVMQMFFQIWKI